MPSNDKILVIGANGHYTLSQLLVERGYRVHAGTRGAHDKHKNQYLSKLGVELFEVDIAH